MFERFTERARQVVVLAQDEARTLHHGAIGSEHMVLGLLLEEQGVAAQALTSVGLWPDRTRAVVAQEHHSNGGEHQQMPFTSDAKRVLERSLREAIRLGHNYIGTEHLLLGLLREEDSAGYRVVQELGVDVEELRELTLQLVSTRTERRALPHAPDVAAALTRAADAAREEGAEQVELRHLRQVLEST